MPERILEASYVPNLTRLEAEAQARLQSALLATNGRQLSDQDVRDHNAALQREMRGGKRPRPPKITAEFLAGLGGVQIKGEPEAPKPKRARTKTRKEVNTNT